MSGRKSYEVTDLLSRGVQIRNELNKKEFTMISNSEGKIASSLKGIHNTLSHMEKKTLPIEGGTQQEFPDEVLHYQQRYTKIIEEAKGLTKTTNGQEYSQQAQAAQKSIQNADRKAEELRRKVTNNPHYCDHEYDEAQKLVKVYDQSKKEIRHARASIEQVASAATKAHTKMTSLRAELDRLLEDVSILNKRAQEIEYIRGQAQLLKEQARAEFARISKEQAEKFAHTPYTNLGNKLKAFELADDKVVVEGYTNMFHQITEVGQTVQQRYEEFETRRKDVNEMMKMISDKLHSFHVTDPLQRIQNKTVEMGLFEYESKFGSRETKPLFEDNWNRVLGLYDREQFDAAEQVLMQIETVLEEAMENCQQTNEYQLKQTFMTQDIVHALNKLGYPEINVDFIDNDFRNGFSVKASVGDEVLHFERLTVNEEGPVIEINHKESVAGTCGPSMQKVMNAMQEQGIFVTDVQKNGRSVIYRDRKATPTSISENSRKRGTTT